MEVQVPNFTDHLHTFSRDLIFGRPNIVTLRLVVNMTLIIHNVNTAEVGERKKVASGLLPVAS
jgi:hypothetical protein